MFRHCVKYLSHRDILIKRSDIHILIRINEKLVTDEGSKNFSYVVANGRYKRAAIRKDGSCENPSPFRSFPCYLLERWLRVKRDNGVDGENGGVMLFAAACTYALPDVFSSSTYVPIIFANYIVKRANIVLSKISKKYL